MTYQSKLKNKDTDDLFQAILALETEEECYRFFEDLCTIKEVQSIAQRLQVAKLLNEKKTYNEIEEITKASTATISRINKCLHYGADGYRLILESDGIGMASEWKRLEKGLILSTICPIFQNSFGFLCFITNNN